MPTSKPNQPHAHLSDNDNNPISLAKKEWLSWGDYLARFIPGLMSVAPDKDEVRAIDEAAAYAICAEYGETPVYALGGIPTFPRIVWALVYSQ